MERRGINRGWREKGGEGLYEICMSEDVFYNACFEGALALRIALNFKS